MFLEYQIVLISVFLSCAIAIILFSLILVLVSSKSEIEKSSTYECGFHPFEDTRQEFNVRYYLVSILFLIFDLEIIYLFPWLINIRESGLQNFYIMFIFLIVLTIGFVYEWLKGALTWE